MMMGLAIRTPLSLIQLARTELVAVLLTAAELSAQIGICLQKVSCNL